MRKLKWVSVLLLAAGAAHAEEGACSRTKHVGLGEGPIEVGFQDGDLATGRRACLRNEFQIGARGGAVVDVPGFYGAVNADGQVAISFALPKTRWEVFAGLAAVHYEYVQNATLKGSEIGLGLLTLGAARLVLETRRFALTPYARLMLPTASYTPNLVSFGGELGLAAEFRPRDSVALHGYLGADITGGVSSARSDVRGGAIADLGVQYSPWSWLGLVLDLQLRMGHRAALDRFAPAVALRFRFRKTVGAELAVVAPVAGADRQQIEFALRIQYRF
jgi:hypothetical protein